MADCDESDALALHVIVKMTLHVHTYGACALVQDRVLGFVIYQAGHCDALFLTTAQHVVPIVMCIPTSFSVDQVSKPHFREDVL